MWARRMLRPARIVSTIAKGFIMRQLFLLFVLSLVGCGAPAETDAGVEVDGDAGELADAGGERDSGLPPSDAGPPPSAKRGSVYAYQSPSGFVSNGAIFADHGPIEARLDCERRVVGACEIETCVRLGDDPLPTLVPLRPGSITVSGESACTIAPSDQYCALASGERYWDPASGGTVTFTAAGGELPAFTVEVDAPTLATLTAPTATEVPRASDLAITWTGGSGTIRAIGGGWSSTSDRRATVQCEAPASAGALTVPAEALQALMNDHPIGIEIHTEEVRDVGGYETTFSATSFLGQVYLE
jgi:hypothetical protein